MKLVPVHVNGESMCYTDERHKGYYWKSKGRWYYSDTAEFWYFLSNIRNKGLLKSLRRALSKAMRYYKLCCPTGYQNHPNPIVYIGNPPEEK